MIEVLYEDNHLIAIAKPAGMLTHGDETGDESILDKAKAYIKKKYNKPGDVFLQPVHRLDRPTSGLILFARTSKATTRMTTAFKKNEIEKSYKAIVSHQTRKLEEKLTGYLLKDNKNNIVKIVDKSISGAKKSELTYRLSIMGEDAFLLDVYPTTGRSHQIRVQLAHIGSPIIGDLKYGSKIKTDGRSIALHAYELKFIHPTKKEQVIITCPLPKNDIWKKFL